MNIGVVIGSIRAARKADTIMNWLLPELYKEQVVHWVTIDLRDYDLPFAGDTKDTKDLNKLSLHISQCDALLFVTSEFNHSVPGPLKNAIDLLSFELLHKPAGVVAYGFSGNGARAAEHLKLILSSFSMRVLEPNVLLSLMEDIKETVFVPRPMHYIILSALVKDLIEWIPYCNERRAKLPDQWVAFDYNEEWQGQSMPGTRPLCLPKTSKKDT